MKRKTMPPKTGLAAFVHASPAEKEKIGIEVARKASARQNAVLSRHKKAKSRRLRRYQKRAIQHVVNNVASAIFLDPGLGKTTIASFALVELQKQGLDHAVVIAPLQVCLNTWTKAHPETDFNQWPELRDLRIELLHGDDKEAALTKPADLYVINPEGLDWLYDHWPEGWVGKRLMLVVDESTQFKSHQSKRFKILAGRKHSGARGDTTYEALLNYFERRVVMTGTPTSEGLTDLWAQIYLLDQGRALGKYITQYRRQYFYPTGFGGYTWAPKDGAREAIIKRITPYAVRLDAADHVDLPEVIEQDIFVDLPADALAAYKVLDKEFVLQLRGGSITAANAGARTSKLRQLTNGAVYLDGQDRDYKVFHAAKLDALARLREELGPEKPLLIAYDFHHDLARLKELLGKDTPHLTPANSTELVAAWNSGQLRNFLVHPKSGKHGLNLQFGGHGLVWFALTWSYEEWFQLIRRLPRPGRVDPVFVYYLLARDTVDERVRRILPEVKGADERKFLTLLKNSYTSP